MYNQIKSAFFHWLPLVILIICIFFIIGFILNSVGMIGHTIVERTMYENSYQRSEGLKARIATDEVALAEIKMQLNNNNLDANTRTNLEAQTAAIRIRIATAKEMQK